MLGLTLSGTAEDRTPRLPEDIISSKLVPSFRGGTSPQWLAPQVSLDPPLNATS